MRKSTIMKVSNASFFREVKRSLHSYRRVFAVEARLIIKERNEPFYRSSKTKSYRVFLKLAKEAFDREEFKEACLNIKECLALLEKTPYSINDFDRARIYEFAAKIYKLNYRFHHSILFFRKSLAILNNIFGEDSIFSPSVLYELADSYSDNLMPREAIFYYRQFLKIKGIQASNDIKQKIFVLYQISSAYYWIFGYKKTIRLLKKCVSLNRKYVGEYNIIHMGILFSIAKIYLSSDRKEKAKKYMKKCFGLFENVCFRNQMTKEMIYDMLICYYRATEMLDHSLYIAKKAIKHLKTLTENNYLSIVYKYRNLSEIYHAKNEHEKRFYYLNKCLIIHERIVGPKHPVFICSLLEYLYVSIGNDLSRKALEILRNIPEEFKLILKSNILIRSKYKLVKGSIYTGLSITKKALEKLNEAKSLYFEAYGKYHPLYIECGYQIGSNLLYEGNFNEAIAVCQETFKLSQRIFSHFSPCSARLLNLIALVYFEKGDIANSLEYFKKLLHVYKELGLENTYNTKEAYLYIANLYGKQSKFKLFFYFLLKSLDLKIKDNVKMKHYYCTLYDIIGNYFHNSQNYKLAKRGYTKSLRIYLSQYSYSVSHLILKILLIAECDIYLKNNSNTNKLYKICKNLNEELVKNGEINSTNKIAPRLSWIRALFYYNSLKKYEECLTILKNTIYLHLKLNNKYTQAVLNVCIMISNVYCDMEEYSKSIQYSKLCLKMEFKTYRNLLNMSNIYEKIGQAYDKLRNFDKCLKYIRKSLRIRKTICDKNDDKLKKIYHSIGINYLNQNRADIALKYMKEGLTNSSISANMNLMETCLLNSIGMTYFFIDERLVHKASKIFQICEEIARANKYDMKYTITFIQNSAAAKMFIEKQRDSWKKDNYCKRAAENASIQFGFIRPP